MERIPETWSRREILQESAAVYANFAFNGSVAATLRTPNAPAVKTGLESLIEHGVRGDEPAGRGVENSRDPRTEVPVFSLYGRVKKPTAAMVGSLDALVFDMQDIGAQSYTSILHLYYDDGAVHGGGCREPASVVCTGSSEPWRRREGRGKSARPALPVGSGILPDPLLSRDDRWRAGAHDQQERMAGKRCALSSDGDPDSGLRIWTEWTAGSRAFRSARQLYLLYP